MEYKYPEDRWLRSMHFYPDRANVQNGPKVRDSTIWVAIGSSTQRVLIGGLLICRTPAASIFAFKSAAAAAGDASSLSLGMR